MEVEECTNIKTEKIESNNELIEIEQNDFRFSSEEENTSNNNNKKGCRLHTIKSKIKILGYAERNKIKEAVL